MGRVTMVRGFEMLSCFIKIKKKTKPKKPIFFFFDKPGIIECRKWQAGILFTGNTNSTQCQPTVQSRETPLIFIHVKNRGRKGREAENDNSQLKEAEFGFDQCGITNYRK